jgi:hypothetical protein
MKCKYKFILNEVLVVLFVAWIAFIMAEFIKPGLISNYYDLNIHFIAMIFLFGIDFVLTKAD